MNRQQRLAFNEKNIAEFRSTGGKLRMFGDSPVLLLTTIGSKSGQSRTSPMMYLADENSSDRIYVFASAAGDDHNPAWFGNLVANPTDVTVEIGAQTWRGEAEVLPESRRAAVFAKQAALYPGFAQYQAKTSRPIPVVAITLKPLTQ
jgi:deazaflavin-dependent oxidoreductase (nitroreductase family)